MKPDRIRINWLIPALGIVLIASGALAAATYLEYERANHSAELSMAAMNRLSHDLELGSVLRTFHEGDASAAARHLDLVLCNDIVGLNSQLAAMDAGDRAFIKNAFVRLSLIRPRSAQLLTDATQGLREDQVEAERILAHAGAGIMPESHSVAVLP